MPERHSHLQRRIELDQGILFIGILAALDQQVLCRNVIIAVLDYLISIQEGDLSFRVVKID